MGATNFQTAATGKTAEEAFVTARQQALYDHGHAGYSGTIAEKHDFVLIPDGIRKPDQFEQALSELAYDDGYWLRERVKEAKRSVLNKTRGAKGELVKAERDLAKAEKERARMLKKLGPLAATAQKYAETWNDKWGPAVAYEVVGIEATRMLQRGYGVAGVTAEHKDGKWVYRKKRGHKVFVFTGIASC